jgi:hypothetical protein
MLKKVLILFISAHLCAAESPKKTEIPVSNNSSAKAIGIGLAAFVVYTILPNIVEGENGKRIATFAGAALGAYSLTQLCSFNTDTDGGSQKMSPLEANEAYKKTTSKQAFRTCLLNNAHKQRNPSGIPSECENLAHM